MNVRPVEIATDRDPKLRVSPQPDDQKKRDRVGGSHEAKTRGEPASPVAQSAERDVISKGKLLLRKGESPA